MSTKDTLENLARNTWLAGLGSINSSTEALGKSIDLAQEKSNKLYNELVTRGEEIQTKINDKKDEIEAKGKKFLGMDSDQSHDEKLAQLNATVDKLTNVVASLVEKRSSPAVKVAKTAPKAKAAANATPKAEPKAATATKPAETAVKATKPITEATPNKAK